MDNVHMCDYGCGREAKFQLKNGKWCCSKNHGGCSSVKEKNANKHKKPRREKPKVCDYGCGQEPKFYFKKVDKWGCCERIRCCPSIGKKIIESLTQPRREKPKVCDYGCGQEPKFYFKTVDKWCCSPNDRQCKAAKRRQPRKKPELCDYGCGRPAIYYNKHKRRWYCSDYIKNCPEWKRKYKGHPLKGKTFEERFGTKKAEEWKKNISSGGKGRIVPRETVEKIREKNKGRTWNILFTPEVAKELRRRRSETQMGIKPWNTGFTKETHPKVLSISKKLSGISRPYSREYMLNGGAAYACSCNKDPSKPQVELYNRVKSLYPSAILNFPCLRGKEKEVIVLML